MVILSHFYNDVILNQNRFVLPWLYTPLIPNEKFKMVFLLLWEWKTLLYL